MGIVRWVALLGALACGCTQDFGKFVGDAGDSGGGDSGTDAPTCNVSQTCVSAASTCGQSCLSGYNTCVGNCGGSQFCKSQCKNQQGTCDTTCIANCVACTDAGTCAQTACQSALP